MSTKFGTESDRAIGAPLDRVDGKLKVTGRAKYAGDLTVDRCLHAVAVQSRVAKGTIARLDATVAERAPGVRAVFSHFNKPVSLPKSADPETIKKLLLFEDNKISYSGQIIALVVADSLEAAAGAASLLEIDYKESRFEADFQAGAAEARATPRVPDYQRGSVEKSIKTGDAVFRATYSTPTEMHNPMEPFAVIAQWQGDSLTVYDTTQAVFQSRDVIANLFELPAQNVHIVSRFVGGGFGCKLTVWSHVALAAMAAKKLGTAVKVVLGRRQMYGPVGFRPATIQKITLAASKSGDLLAIVNEGITETSRFKEFTELVGDGSRMAYRCPNVKTSLKLVPLDIGYPTWMRAPGHAPGSFALESAIDELAAQLKIDPIEFRLRNFAETDPESQLPWSSNELKHCYREGAKRFGWHDRSAAPRSMRRDGLLVGMGMAMALHTGWRNPATAHAEIDSDGNALVQSGSQEIGTGTATIMTQIAADALSLPPARVKFELGDSHLPFAPMSGGSTTAGSVGTAVHRACKKLYARLVETAVKDKQSPLFGAAPADVIAAAGRLHLKGSPDRGESYGAVASRAGGGKVSVLVDSKPGDDERSLCSFGAQFAEVTVDPDLGNIRVARFLGVYAGGRILNAKTARSQMLGGIVFGIGMALMEQVLLDQPTGRIINPDLGDYHIPVNADINNLDVVFVEERDTYINDLGAKGIGELGITGVAAAIANAVYHATGKRVRDLPITLDNMFA